MKIEIETKFNLGDTVYFRSGLNIYESLVKEIRINGKFTENSDNYCDLCYIADYIEVTGYYDSTQGYISKRHLTAEEACASEEELFELLKKDKIVYKNKAV